MFEKTSELISEILKNKNLLAECWMKIFLDRYKFNYGGVWVGGEECVYIATSQMNQYSKIEDAFTAVLKKFVYFTLEWNDELCNDMTIEDWVASFTNIEPKFQLYPDVFYNDTIIKEMDYINLKSEILRNIINLDTTKFDEERLSDFKIVESMANEIISNSQNLKVLILNNEWNDLFLFGVSDNLCFIYNWYTTG